MKKRALELAVVMACASALLGACVSESADDMLSSAKGYLAKKDDKAAVLQLKNALQKKSDLAEARFLLGKTLLEQGEPVTAAVELRKAQELKYPEAEIAPLLAKALIGSRDYRKVTDQYGKVTLPDNAATAELKTSVATAYALQGEMPQAHEAARAAIEALPGYAPAMILEARLAVAERQVDKALAVLDRVIAANPADKDALQLKGDLLVSKSDSEGALAAYRKVLTVDPKHVGAQSGVIDQFLAKRDIEGAKAQLELLRKAHPEHPQTLYYDSQLAYLANDTKRARELVEKVLKVAPNNARALELAGAVELKDQALLRAADYFSKALQVSPGLMASRRLLAQTLIQSGQPDKALAVLEPLLARGNADATTLSLAATADAQTGNLKRAEAHIVEAAKRDPESTKSRVALALDRNRDGNIDTALSEIEKIAAADSGAYADFVLVNAHLRRGELDKALKNVDAIAKKQPGKPFADNIRGRIHLLRRDPASARRSFEQAVAIDPTFVPAVASLALLDLGEQKPDEAKKRFEAVLAVDPKNTQAMLALAGLQARSGASSEEVAKLIVKASNVNPTALPPRLALVDHYLSRNDGKRAMAAAQDGVAALPQSAEMLDALARAQLAAGERNQAINSFNKLAALQPGSPQPHLRMAGVHMEAKEYDEARRSLQRALALKPKLLAAQRALAEVEFRSGRVDEALAVARSVRKQQPADDTGYVLEGAIEASRKNLAGAAEIYRAGLKQAASTQLAVKLHATLVSMDKAAEAEKFSATWQKEHPKDAQFVSYLGESALAHRDYAAAEGYFRRVDQLVPNNALVMNNLAWVLAQLNKPGAVAYAEKANALYPNKPMFMDTLAIALAADKQMAKAIDTEKQALLLAPEAHGLRLTLAKLYIQAGDKPAARVELDKLAKLDKKFPAQDEVTKLLASL